jgi:hypothetical protein
MLLLVDILGVSDNYFEFHAVHFDQVWLYSAYNLCCWMIIAVCSSRSNLKQQPTFILPRAALNITQLGSGQSGTFPASTFPREQKDSNGQADKALLCELLWYDTLIA